MLGGDAVLTRCLKEYPGVRVPGAWDGFELAVRAILGQQVSVKAATTLSGRIVARYGRALDTALAKQFEQSGLTHLFPAPETLMRARYNGLGIVGARIETVRRIARATVDQQLILDDARDPEDFLNELVSIRGVGDWTAQYIAMRATKNPDAFPSSDLGLLRAFDSPAGERITAKALKERSQAWRPWRAYAALLLWNSTPNSGG